MVHQYVKILLLLGMLAAVCGTASAAMGIVAETHDTSSGSTPVCTAPCECISEADAATRWGAEGYDRCSKTICGQSANAMVQYYCFHQIGGTSSATPAGNTIAATSAAALQVTSQIPLQSQTTIQAPVQTPAQVPATSATAAAGASPSYTWPAPGVTPQQRSPVGLPISIAAVGIALIAFAVKRME